MVVFPKCKRVLDKIKDVVLSCVIEVISSVEFQVRISKCNYKFPACLNKMCNILTELQIHPDEVEDDGEVMLIWDFNMVRINLSFTASQCSVKAKIPSSVDTIYSMPYLDPNRVSCNCAKSSKQVKALLLCGATPASQLQRLSLSHRNDDGGLEEEGEEDAQLVEVELENSRKKSTLN